MPSDLDRILAQVQPEPTSGCWLWLGSTNGKKGYGKTCIGGRKGRQMLVHRFVYEALVGPIPEGLGLDHVRARGCASTLCCNPDHLEPVTGAENTRRGGNAIKTHCVAGHDLSDACLIERTTTDGRTRFERHCRACRAAGLRRLRERRRKCQP